MSPTQFVTSIALPESQLLKAANKSDAHRKCVNYALNHKLQPIPVPKEKQVALSLNLHADMLAKLQHKGKEYNMSVSAMFGALAHAGYVEMDGLSAKNEEARETLLEGGHLDQMLLLTKKDGRREEQDRFWRALASGLQLNQVVMAEASTGVGKGRAIVSAAVMCAKQGKVPVVVAAPSIRILGQLWGEMASPVGLKAIKGLKVAFLPGRQEFVDSDRLLSYLDSSHCKDDAVRDWVSSGAPANVAGHLPSAARLAGIKLSWLMSDLREIATDLRAEDFSLNDHSSPECEGALQLASLRRYAAGADIVFCTQTMLALMHKFGWRQLPRFIEKKPGSDEYVYAPVVLIDEAHLFEEMVSQVEANSLSLSMLRFHFADAYRRLGGGKGSPALKQAIKEANAFMDTCKGFWSKDDSRLVVATGRKDWQGGGDSLHQSAGVLLPHVKKLIDLMGKKGAMAGVFGLDDSLTALKHMQKVLTRQDEYSRLLMEFSPTRKFPSFVVGAANVGPYMSNLWFLARGGVGLVSATFNLMDPNGRWVSDYMRKILNLPMDRLYIPEPVVWREIYASPQRLLPHPDVAAELVPPEDHTSLGQLDRWCAAQAGMIKRFNDGMVSPDGGTLILCTSYAQVASLSQCLIKEGIDEDRLILNSGRLAVDRDAFVQAHRTGKKPLWLALGPAWTGLDLRDEGKAPGEDTLLSDLIITRIPLGLNRSATMDARMALNINSITQEAMLKFKQGLGRIIRAAGLPNRRILLLDGRLVAPSKSQFIQRAMGSAVDMVRDYKKKGFFPLSGEK